MSCTGNAVDTHEWTNGTNTFVFVIYNEYQFKLERTQEVLVTIIWVTTESQKVCQTN